MAKGKEILSIPGAKQPNPEYIQILSQMTIESLQATNSSTWEVSGENQMNRYGSDIQAIVSGNLKTTGRILRDLNI